jgi:hypothetical protein
MSFIIAQQEHAIQVVKTQTKTVPKIDKGANVTGIPYLLDAYREEAMAILNG